MFRIESIFLPKTDPSSVWSTNESYCRGGRIGNRSCLAEHLAGTGWDQDGGCRLLLGTGECRSLGICSTTLVGVGEGGDRATVSVLRLGSCRLKLREDLGDNS